MSESKSHKRAKKRAAGKGGRTEVPLNGGKRLDAASSTTATEVERSGSTARLEAAARRLKASRKKKKVLMVPHKDLDKAAEALESQKVKGMATNLSRTKRRFNK